MNALNFWELFSITFELLSNLCELPSIRIRSCLGMTPCSLFGGAALNSLWAALNYLLGCSLFGALLSIIFGLLSILVGLLSLIFGVLSILVGLLSILVWAALISLWNALDYLSLALDFRWLLSIRPPLLSALSEALWNQPALL